MRSLFKFAAVAALAAGLTPATAAVVTVNQILDLTKPESKPGPGFQGWQDTPAFNGGYNVAIAEGDSFDFTIDFVGSQSLTLINAVNLWAFSYASTSTDVTGTGSLSLLDINGTAFLTSNVKTDTEGVAHFGQQFDTSEFAGGLPATLTFYGLRYVGTVDDYVDPTITSRDYYSPAFYFTADNNANAVPEPATWALMLGGFGLAGSALRRRRDLVTA